MPSIITSVNENVMSKKIIQTSTVKVGSFYVVKEG